MATKKKIAEWEPSSAPCPFENDQFLALWINLLAMPKWRKKPLTAIEMSCTRLKRFHVDFAAMLVESAIEGNYQGVVFPDSAQKFENWKKQNTLINGNATHRTGFGNNNQLGTSEARIKKASEW